MSVHTGFSFVFFNEAANSGAGRYLFLKEVGSCIPSQMCTFLCPYWIQLQYVSGDFIVHLFEKSLISSEITLCFFKTSVDFVSKEIYFILEIFSKIYIMMTGLSPSGGRAK